MQIVADENMPFARELFGRLGTVRTLPGRAITRGDLAGADALMVRSITKVNEALLAGTPVRFVGTATIGTDHIDQAWLGEQGIGFAAAPGCNAESVAQYVAAVLAWVSGRLGRTLAGATLGVIGAGNCGSRVARVGRALGMNVVLNDPPLARATGDAQYKPLKAALACDYIALHVPLTREGPDATWRLIDFAALARINPGAVIINACRGGVLDELAALDALGSGRISGLVLDAWDGEPALNPAVLGATLLGTPHIAGYSYDGKVAGTRMIYEAACRYFEQTSSAPALSLPEPNVAEIAIETRGRDFQSVVSELILTAYPIHRDDGDLRRVMLRAHDEATRGQQFDLRRKLYPLRREFGATRVLLRDAPAEWLAAVAALGFEVVQNPAATLNR